MIINFTGTVTELIDLAETIKAGQNARISSDMKALLEAGELINAVRLRRAQTGCSLKEAKDWVESQPMFVAARHG